MEGRKRAEEQTEIGAKKATISIKISISKSANLKIELEMLSDGATSITAAKKKKSSSSTTVIEVGVRILWERVFPSDYKCSRENEQDN